MREVATPIIYQYKPRFMLVSAGLDGHYTDPVASLSLSALCYQKIYEIIVNLASEICEGKLVSVLEGGYSLKLVGKIAAAAIAKMTDAFYIVDNKVPVTSKRNRRQGEKVITDVKAVQRVFWNLD
jgi:acetoin utilization deacetylase AcuC-like enzyme